MFIARLIRKFAYKFVKLVVFHAALGFRFFSRFWTFKKLGIYVSVYASKYLGVAN